MKSLTIVVIALKNVRRMQWTLDRREVGHLLEKKRVSQSQQSCAGGLQLFDHLGETVPAWMACESLAPQPEKAVTAEARSLCCL